MYEDGGLLGLGEIGCLPVVAERVRRHGEVHSSCTTKAFSIAPTRSSANKGPRMLELQGKSAFVTGGTRGIGLAVSDLLAQRGARVVACGSTEASVCSCREYADRAGLTIRLIKADVNREDEIAAEVRGPLEWWVGYPSLLCGTSLSRISPQGHRLGLG